MLKYVTWTAKAISAAILAAATGVASALSNDTSLGDMTDAQWAFIVLGTLVAFFAVFGISNTPLVKK